MAKPTSTPTPPAAAAPPAEPAAPVKRLPGRPTKMTPAAIKILEDEFLKGASKVEACLVAGISRDSLYNYEQANPGYADRIEELQNWPKVQARRNVAEAIEQGSREMSQWYLERKAKDEFSRRNELTGADGEELFRGFIDAVQNRSGGLPKDDGKEP